ncbi:MULTISPECIES: cold-shock protein [Amycolatopsis]|uniref:Cold-shock protein n=1 Tax=Amycolatopsis albidoflavus TaxID=102226 RepID=A0ABW5HT08_9PSEU
MTTGTVVRFDEVRGYGFVSPDEGGEDVFIHANDLQFDKHMLSPGVQVVFDAEEGDRGLKASRVRLQEAPEPVAIAEVRSIAPVAPVAVPADADDILCDVLSASQFAAEMAETLLVCVPALTSEQILAVRERMLTLARAHGWLED